MMIKVFDLLRSLGWYLINFIYNLIDGILEIIKKLNAVDIINTLSNNKAFNKFYTGILTISLTLFALFIIWRFINKMLNPDDENTIKNIMLEILKCGTFIMMSTFLFIQVSNFSITLSNYTSSIFENSNNTKISDNMLSMFISYKDSYKNSDKFSESKSIDELIHDGTFDNEELYLAKFVTKSRVILSDNKDYKYDINWIMAILSGGFFLYSLFFSGILLGRKQIEFLFLFLISPVVFATSICNKQRRGAVIEQLVSLSLQSAVVMLIVNLTIMIMQEINSTIFFTNDFLNLTAKSLLYLGCATFILTGSQIINRFIGTNVSASSGREQLMSLMGYGKTAGIGATIGTGTALGAGLLATGGAMKGGKIIGSQVLSQAGIALGTLGINNGNQDQTRLQKFAQTMGSKMYVAGQKMNKKLDLNKQSTSDAFINAGANSLSGAIRKVVPRSSYNASYYRRKNFM